MSVGTVPDWAAVERYHVHDGQRVMLAYLPGSAGVYVVDPGYGLDSPLRRFGPFTEERALEIAACHASFGAVDCPDATMPDGEVLRRRAEDAIDQAAAMWEHGEGETC